LSTDTEHRHLFTYTSWHPEKGNTKLGGLRLSPVKGFLLERSVRMKCFSSLALVVLLSVGSGVPAVTLSAVVPATPGASCEQTPNTSTPPGPKKTAIPATVTGVDREHGVLNLETEVARAQVVVPPEALQNLHVGDQVELCMADEEPSQNLLQDSIRT